MQVVVTLGALLGDVPAHAPGRDDAVTPPTPRCSSAWASSASSYEGPTGIVGVLHTACARGGPALGEPVGGGAPLRGGGVQPEGRAGAAAPDRSPDRRVGRRLRARDRGRGLRAPGRAGGASDPDIQAFVERLEQAADSEEQTAPEDVPSGDILAREFQRFLRQRGREGK